MKKNGKRKRYPLDLDPKKNDKPEVAGLKKIFKEKNLSCIEAASIARISPMSLYRYIKTGRGERVVMRGALKRLESRS